MMQSPLAHDRTDHFSEHAVEILILSLDDALIAQVESSLEGAYRVHHARSAALAVDMLYEHEAGVLITDEAVAHPAFQKLARQWREQFPHLIVIGIGEREVAPSLIDLVNSGQIYRFLLKPLSPGQVRLRVQSAARQHLALRDGTMAEDLDDGIAFDRRVRPEQLPPYEQEPARAASGRRRPLVIGGVVAAVAAAIVLAIVLMPGGEEPDAPVASAERPSAPGAEDAPETVAEPLSEVERSLDAASLALQEGRYVEPVEDNALDHYLTVLEIEPQHPEAAAGLDTIASALLERAQTALGENNPTAALDARTIVQGIRPDHPDMPLVDAQFAEHGRLLISRMNLAVAADDWTRAREQLDLAAQFLPQESPELTAARELLDERRDQFAINDRLAVVDARLEANSLTVPEDDSALSHLLALKADYPESEAVLAGLTNFAGIMLQRADTALASEDTEAAERWLAAADQLGVEAQAIAARRESLASLQEEAAQAAQADAGEAVAAEGAPADAAGADVAAAAQAEADPDQVGPPTSIAAATPAGPEPVAVAATPPVEVSELEILRMVQPEYPRRAYVRNIDGWIDLEFTVTITGLTRAIEVTGAKSRGWFERAAVEAVEQWQFRPELQNGEPVERRAKVRLQFARED